MQVVCSATLTVSTASFYFWGKSVALREVRSERNLLHERAWLLELTQETERKEEKNNSWLLFAGSQLSFLCPDKLLSTPLTRLGAIRIWNGDFLRRLCRAGLSTAWRTDLGTGFVSQKRLHEVVRGPHACLFCRLHLPTSAAASSSCCCCSNLWRNKISDWGGGLISAEE